jgi:hypothetical protein
VLVAVHVLDLLGAIGDKVSWLAALEACPRVPPLVHPVLVHPLKRLVSSASSSSPNTSNSSSSKDIKEDKENILVDRLAFDFPFKPPMRERL